MTRGVWIALGIVGAVAAVGGVYVLFLRGRGSSASVVGGVPTSAPPPPAASSPETTWGGRALDLLDHALDVVPEIVDKFH